MSGSRRSRTIRFGEVTVPAVKLSKAHVAEQVRRSTEALERALPALAKPGVRIRVRKGVPMFRVDPQDPAILIRELDGVQERGVMEDGRFTIRR